MSLFFQSVGIAMVVVILCLFIGKQNKDFALLVSLAACCAVALCAMQYFGEVLTFVNELKALANMDDAYFEVLLKAVGIGIISEIAVLICADSGNSALGKTIHMIAVAAILWTALPLLSALLELMNQILGEV